MAAIQIDVNVSTPYRVHIGTRLLEEAGQIVQPLINGQKCAIVTDSNVGPLYAHIVRQSLEGAGFSVATFTFEAGEERKTLATYGEILEFLAAHELDRGDAVIALGGGVVGDMAGFAAATYLRGIAYVQVPTSLLAMVDSSVGGKCAVDLSEGKNLAGAFWQPRAVIADVGCLGTLTPERLADGCGEVIKHALIADPALFAALEEAPLTFDLLTSNLGLVAAIVARNVEIKRDVVAADERELGLRKMLNFGHSIGHAIEAHSDYTLGHGTCVAMGMVAISRAQAARAEADPQIEFDPALPERIASLCQAHGLATTCPYPADDLLDAALHDKKRHGSTIDLVMLHAIGSCSIETHSIAEFFELIELGLAGESTSDRFTEAAPETARAAEQTAETIHEGEARA